MKRLVVVFLIILALPVLVSLVSEKPDPMVVEAYYTHSLRGVSKEARSNYLNINQLEPLVREKDYVSSKKVLHFPFDINTYKIYLTSPFGRYKNALGEQPHAGLDLATARANYDLYAVADGTVIGVYNNTSARGYSIDMRIELDTGIMGTVTYMHMRDAVKFKVGDSVRAGEKVGVVGTTGNSSGIHLHYEIITEDKYVTWSNFTEMVKTRLNPLDGNYFEYVNSNGELITNPENLISYVGIHMTNFKDPSLPDQVFELPIVKERKRDERR